MMSLVKEGLAKCDDYCRLHEEGRRQMRPDRAEKSLVRGGVARRYDFRRVSEEGQSYACPAPAFEHGHRRTELVRFEKFVLYLPKMLSAKLGGGGRRHWAVSRFPRGRFPADDHSDCYCLRYARLHNVYQGFVRLRSGRGSSIVWKVNSGRLRRVSCVSSVSSELRRRLVTCVVGRALVVGDLSEVARVVPRRLVCVASVIIAVTVVVKLSGGIPTTVRVASDTVGAHTLLPTTAGVTVVAELTELGVKAAATVEKMLSTGPKRVINTVTVQTASFVIAKRLCSGVRRKKRSPQCGVIGVVTRVRHVAYGVPVRRIRGLVVVRRKRIQFIIVSMSDSHHNRVARETHVSRMGRRGGRSTLREIACMRLQRRVRRRGQIKIFFAVYGRSFISRPGLERQPHGINRSKRDRHGGQSTQIKFGHKPGELVHHSTANQFQNSRHAGSKFMLGAHYTRDHHSKRPKEVRKRSSISYAESLQPMVRSSSIAVIEMAANEPKELVESLRPAGVSI